MSETKCKARGCVWPALPLKEFCRNHLPVPERVEVSAAVAEEDATVIPLDSVPPEDIRRQTRGVALAIAIRSLSDGHALKIKLPKDPKKANSLLISVVQYCKKMNISYCRRRCLGYAYFWKPEKKAK